MVRSLICLRSLLVCSLCLTLFGCGDGTPAAEQIEFTNPLHDPEFKAEQMNAIVQFDEAEMPAIQAAFDARAAAHAEWLNLRKNEVDTTQGQLAKAKASGDTNLVRSYEVKLRPALLARRQIMLDHEASILALMTPESLERWQTYLVTKKTTELMEPLKLSAAQQQQVEEWAREAVEAFPDSEDRLSGAFYKLEKRLEEESLSAEQKEQYTAIKLANPRRSVTW